MHLSTDPFFYECHIRFHKAAIDASRSPKVQQVLLQSLKKPSHVLREPPKFERERYQVLR